jgi:putative ABC transport system permease protein
MRPIVAALKHHKSTVLLIVLEIALTCAIVSNALFLIGDRLSSLGARTGVDQDALIQLGSNGLGVQADQPDQVETDLAALRAIPGVRAAVQLNSLPLDRNDWRVDLRLRPGAQKADLNYVAEYIGTPGTVEALGLHLIAGRDFLPQEYGRLDIFGDKPPPSAVIVTHALAERLWPAQNPLQQVIRQGDRGKYASRVVGVVDHLLAPALTDSSNSEYTILLPVKAIHERVFYVVHTLPAQRNRVLHDARAALLRINADRVIDGKIYTQIISDYFHDTRATIWLLSLVVAALLALSSLGVVGLSSFWVQQRTRQIGIRRALGASRGDILKYFHVENLLIVGMGIGVGSLAALALNLWLMSRYALPRMPMAWLLISAVVLWVLGQLAVLGPALRAAAVSPAAATRQK